MDEPVEVDDLFWLYSNYQKGVLPDGAVLNANPHKLVQAFRVIDGALAEAKAERDAVLAKKRARK